MPTPEQPRSRIAWPTPRRLLEYLAAILAGNAIYFWVLSPNLPAALRHTPFREDWGLVVDFCVCAAIYGIFARLKRKP